MVRMDVWGQGAVFAFSGLESKTDFDSQLVGSLLGDHPGVRFAAPHPFELYMGTSGVADLIWEIVASDIVLGKALIDDKWMKVCFAFRSNASLVGICPPGRLRLVFDSENADPAVSLTTVDAPDGCRFCLSLEETAECDPREIEEIIGKRAAFYDRFQPRNPDENVAKAYLHAVSVMKSQVCSPEGVFRHLWTTPDRYPHRKLWLWD